MNITSDNGTTNGAIDFDFVFDCGPDSLAFNWSNGSMDTTLSGIAGGDYNLTISNPSGLVDSFSFTVPSVDFLELICPSDTTVSCISSIDPSVIGAASMTGYDAPFGPESHRVSPASTCAPEDRATDAAAASRRRGASAPRRTPCGPRDHGTRTAS